MDILIVIYLFSCFLIGYYLAHVLDKISTRKTIKLKEIIIAIIFLPGTLFVLSLFLVVTAFDKLKGKNIMQSLIAILNKDVIKFRNRKVPK